MAERLYILRIVKNQHAFLLKFPCSVLFTGTWTVAYLQKALLSPLKRSQTKNTDTAIMRIFLGQYETRNWPSPPIIIIIRLKTYSQRMKQKSASLIRVFDKFPGKISSHWFKSKELDNFTHLEWCPFHVRFQSMETWFKQDRSVNL